jgi:hypothetical protein
MTTDKSRVTITKIQFTPEELEDIESIKSGRPVKEIIQRYKERGWDVEKWIGHRIPSTSKYRTDILKKKYYGGYCHINQCWPDYKVVYVMKDAKLVEYYCSEHMPSDLT